MTCSRFNGHHIIRYKTVKCLPHPYTFMVAVNLPIKAEEQSSEFLPLLKLQSIRRWWRQCGGGCAVFPICQLLDRQQQTVNQWPLRLGRPSRCSEQTNYGGVVRVCVYSPRQATIITWGTYSLIRWIKWKQIQETGPVKTRPQPEESKSSLLQ